MTTDYAGNFVYEGGNLQFLNHSEGYIEPDGSGGYDYIQAAQDGTNQISNLLDGNYYQAGLIGGYNSAQGTLDLAITAGTFGLGRGMVSINPFGLRGGYGVFGRQGLNIGGYKIEALYANPSAGSRFGTIFSLRQMKQGGAIFRWDYGPLHKGGNGLHSTIRFYMFNKKIGSSAQRTWYPPYYKLK
ncbi:hypothetical protein [Ulvibacterium marinum]|uniref:hypothetical protein n=1 Tax=Ulvibacterium marinum TaxID=2419782 RepID=UPI002494A508|nr:hypothetical protein [Ulvibacterium marinum]